MLHRGGAGPVTAPAGVFRAPDGCEVHPQGPESSTDCHDSFEEETHRLLDGMVYKTVVIKLELVPEWNSDLGSVLGAYGDPDAHTQ